MPIIDCETPDLHKLAPAELIEPKYDSEENNHKLRVDSGKAYKINIVGRSNVKTHIDYILDNPTDEGWDTVLIIGRIWLKRKRRWHHFAEPYWVLAIWNKWEWSKS